MSAVLNGVSINGNWHAGPDVLAVINPATEATLALVRVGNAATVTQAVDAASHGFIEGSKSTGRDRHLRVLRQCRRRICVLACKPCPRFVTGQALMTFDQ